MTQERKSLSKAELDALKVLWEHGPLPVRSVQSHLSDKNWAYTTAKTVLDRLAAKRYVRKDRATEPHIYVPTVSRDDLLESELEVLRDAVCNGEIGPLVHALVQGIRIGAEDADELRALLGQLSQEAES